MLAAVRSTPYSVKQGSGFRFRLAFEPDVVGAGIDQPPSPPRGANHEQPRAR